MLLRVTMIDCSHIGVQFWQQLLLPTGLFALVLVSSYACDQCHGNYSDALALELALTCVWGRVLGNCSNLLALLSLMPYFCIYFSGC